MPSLRRTAPPLLRQVNNKPHATNKDHEEGSLPTPPASNSIGKKGAGIADAAKKNTAKKDVDIFAEPASSSDEEDATELPTLNKTAATFKPSKSLDPAKKPATNTPTFKVPTRTSPGSSNSKRSASNEDDDLSSDDKMVFSSQTAHSPNKRARLAAAGNARRAGNIHAPPKKSSQMYGKRKVLTTKDRKSQQAKAGGFKTAKGLDLAAPNPQGPTFKAAKGADMFEFGQSEKNLPQFQEARGSVSDSPELSELSELDSDVEEVDPRTLNLPTPKEYVPTVECKGCGKKVPLLSKQEFEDKYNNGKPLSYKKWSWFCDHHKREDARQIWQERGYPEIQWDSIEKRLRAHHDRLLAVLEKRSTSVYRDRLQKRVDSGSTRSAAAAYIPSSSDDGELEIKPGYYGSKGEKLMTDHILKHFADELRDLAVSDSLIGASGVAGGVSGFVQAVLVPEVAVALVKEDMKVDDKQAREIIKESLELGELLNEEAHEEVVSEAENE
ncbi:hypothetical protein Q7P35_003416 [Cladosporium inversicolor]